MAILWSAPMATPAFAAVTDCLHHLSMVEPLQVYGASVVNLAAAVLQREHRQPILAPASTMVHFNWCPPCPFGRHSTTFDFCCSPFCCFFSFLRSFCNRLTCLLVLIAIVSLCGEI